LTTEIRPLALRINLVALFLKIWGSGQNPKSHFARASDSSPRIANAIDNAATYAGDRFAVLP
jgi:hypothetical protein